MGDIIPQDIITDLRVITDCITDIIMVREVRNPHPVPHPHLMPHPNQMPMPQPGITDITDTVMVITIMEEDKKSGIFWKINFSQRQRSHKFKQYGPHRISTTKFKICSRCYYSWQKLDK